MIPRKCEKNILVIPSSLSGGSLGDQAMLLSVYDNLNFSNLYFLIGTDRYWNFLKKKDDLKLIMKEIEWRDDKWLDNIDFDQIINDNQITKAVVLGADTLDGYYNDLTSTWLLNLSTLSKKHQIRCHVLGFSWSDSSSETSVKNINSCIDNTTFYLRDEYSYKKFKKFFPKASTKLVADLAFSLKPSYRINSKIKSFIQNNDNKIKIIVSLAYREKYKQEKLVKVFANVVNNLSNCVILTIPHDYRSNTVELCKNFHRLVQQDKIFIDSITARNLRYICNQSDIILTCLMHLAIAGFSQKVPAVALDYANKMRGLFKFFDMEKFVTEDLKNIAFLLNQILDDLNFYKNKIGVTLEQVIKLSKKNFIF